ncbi:ribosomal protein S8 [Cyathus striatus]|nr:ribosomal protein S8 [Cyathus striatus]
MPLPHDLCSHIQNAFRARHHRISVDHTTKTSAQRRIWATLKYRDEMPVLQSMELISKPSKRIFMDLSEIRRICSGRRVNGIKSLGMGEVAIVKTNDKEHEWLEAREALLMKLPGEVICRAR